MKMREPQLERYKAVWLTREDHRLLREEKTKQSKSIAQLVHELIQEQYGLLTPPSNEQLKL